MKSIGYWAATAFAVCAGAALAQDVPTGPVRLDISLKAGQTRTFKIVSDTILTTTIQSLEPKKTTTKSSGTFEMVVDAVNPDGSYAVKIHTVKQALSVNGADTPAPDGADADVKATLTRDGRFRDVSGAPKLKDGVPAPMTGEDFLNTVFDKEAALPSQPVAVGETWKDKVESPVDNTQPKMTVNNKLVALDLMDATPVARVLRIICEPIQNPSPEPGVTVSGKMEGGGLATMDLASGLVADERDTLRLTVNVEAQNPANSAQKVNLKTEANIKVRVQSAPSA
ncbi:MAG TPA: hypothetical protein VGM51_09680 [Armatimonadota bacterium]|jgi:hypothetical protein